MITRNITFANFDGTTVTETYHFHMSRVDITKMDLDYTGGVQATADRIATEQDKRAMINLIEDLIKRSVGERIDGNSFRKTPEFAEHFIQSNAYEALFIELVEDETGEELRKFIEGVIPKKAA